MIRKALIVAVLLALGACGPAMVQTLQETRLKADQGNADAQSTLGVMYVIVGGAVWAVYMLINALRPAASPPVVDADASPYKSKPLDPGGEHIPDQEKQIFPATSGHPPNDDNILGEAPEQPMAKPLPVIVRQVVKKQRTWAQTLKETRPAAEQGDADAQFWLGFAYWDGDGVPQDYAEAVKWWRLAAEQGDASAQEQLGGIYLHGRGVPQDYAESLKWYGKAADQGDADAQMMLGWMYSRGKGVPQDYVESVKWYRLAAEQGYARAHINLGEMYRDGQGVAQDYAEAVSWFRKAADQGNAHAQYLLGMMYYFGEGVPQDYVQAHKWSNLIAASGDADDRMFREKVAAKMTPAQIAEAQRLASAWRKK